MPPAMLHAGVEKVHQRADTANIAQTELEIDLEPALADYDVSWLASSCWLDQEQAAGHGQGCPLVSGWLELVPMLARKAEVTVRQSEVANFLPGSG